MYEAICRGNFSLAEEERRKFVVREAPLKELKGVVRCTGVENSYFVVTGEHGRCVCWRGEAVSPVVC